MKSLLLSIYSLFALIILSGFVANAKQEIHHEFTQVPAGKKIEYFWSMPEGKGPWPLLILVHPNQDWPNKVGGAMFVDSGFLDLWVEKGWLTVSVSQPGFGKSDGPADFCGPESQNAAQSVIDKFQEMDVVKKGSTVIYGGSRGAVIAAILATKNEGLAGVVLRSGLYNFVDWYKAAPWYDSVKLTMLWELGWPSTDELKERSVLLSALTIKAPVLMLHGEQDERAPVQYAKDLATKIKSENGSVELHTFDSEHIVPQDKVRELMTTFLDKVKK